MAQGKQPYCAFEIGDKESRFLELRMPFPNLAVCLPYAQLVEINSEWRKGGGLILIFSRHPNPIQIKLVGTDLYELQEAVMAWKAVAVAEYDPQAHLPPADPSGPFIKSISVTRGPSKPPVAANAPTS